MNLHKESEENRIIERIEKYIEFDEAIKENLNFCYKFAENIKERYQKINKFNPKFFYDEIICDNNQTFKV